MSGSQLMASMWYRSDDIAPVLTPKAYGMRDSDLEAQNETFSGTGGISQHNRVAGFVPAYCNTETGESVASAYADGSPAPVHVLDGLPESWVAARDDDGVVTRAKAGVIAGFLRDGCFYTREAAALELADGE